MSEGSPATILVTNGRVVSVFTGEIFAADVVLSGSTISGVLPPGTSVEASEVIDAGGRLIAPGYVDAHMHVESTFVTPAAFAELTLPRGTTTVLADPHEIVNVAGKEALRWMIGAGRDSAQSILYGVPSCVPSLAGFETAGAQLDAADIAEMLDWSGVNALGEVMDYRAVVRRDPRMLSIVKAARDKGALIDGHCPGLSGVELSTYMSIGIDSDHCKNPVDVSIEKARMGMMLELQEKCLEPELMARLAELSLMPPICLVTDDLAPDAVLRRGHLDHVAARAVEVGLPPLQALRAITYTPAQRLRLFDRGLVSPGKRADLVLLDDLTTFTPWMVIAGGQVVATEGRLLSAQQVNAAAFPFQDSVHLAPRTLQDFAWSVETPDATVRLRAIRVNPIDTSTEPAEVTLAIKDREVAWEGEVVLLTVWGRHHASAGMHAAAPLVGMALGPDGAIASTYAHDSHNLLVLGTSKTSMVAAANAVIQANGGIAVVRGTEVVAMLPLRVGGLMSIEPAERVAAQAAEVRHALEEWGYAHANAFMSMATLTLPVSPKLKLTDLGLVDVHARAWVEPVAVG